MYPQVKIIRPYCISHSKLASSFVFFGDWWNLCHGSDLRLLPSLVVVWIWSVSPNGSCIEGLSDHWEYLPPKWMNTSMFHMMLLLGSRKRPRCSRKAPLVPGPFLSFCSLVAKGDQLLPYPQTYFDSPQDQLIDPAELPPKFLLRFPLAHFITMTN